LLVEPSLFGDQLGGEQPVDLVPGGADFRRHSLAEHLPDGAEQVTADDRVLLGSDPERDVLVGDAFDHVLEGGGCRVDELHGVGHH
jgi:hypothetical protein